MGNTKVMCGSQPKDANGDHAILGLTIGCQVPRLQAHDCEDAGMARTEDWVTIIYSMPS